MAKKAGGKGNREDPRESSGEKLTRRKAIKRIATAFSGLGVGAGVFGPTWREWGQYSSTTPIQYISIEGSYVDTVYVDYSSAYDRYMSYYNSYTSHYSSVPRPMPHISYSSS